MNPKEFILFLLPVWALTHFWLLPIFKNRWVAGDLRQKIARTGSLIFIEKIRDFSLIAIVATLSVIIFIWLNNVLADGDLILAAGIINSFDVLLKPLNSIKKDYETILICLGLLGAASCLYIINKQAKKKLTNAWIEKALEIRERLGHEQTTLDKLTKNPELKPAVERVEEILGYLSMVNQTDSELVLTQQQVDALQNELNQLLMLLTMEQAKEEIDLNDVFKKPEKVEKPQSKTIAGRIIRIISSNQFAKDLGLLSRPLSYVATGLLILSLIGWASAPLANSLTLSVNNLRINSVSSDVARDLDLAISRIDEKPAENKNDTTESIKYANEISQISRVLAREAVNQLIQTQSLGEAKRTQTTASEFVRAAIVNQSYSSDNLVSSSQRVRANVAQQITELGSSERQVSDLVEVLEHEISNDIGKVQRRNPSYFSELVNKVEARYANSVNAIDAQSNLISRVVSQAFSPIDVDAANEIIKQGGKVLKDVGEESVKKWANSYAKAVVTDALFEQSHASVVEKLNKNFRFHTSEQTKQLFTNLSSAENTGWQASPKDASKQRVNQDLALKIANRYSDETVKVAVRQSLGGYSQLFPDVIVAAADATARASGTLASSSRSRTSTDVTSRSTNFKMASRSFRVRGVLFGQNLTGDNLDITDIRWQIKPNSQNSPTLVALMLKLEGEWYDVGTFPASIVNQGIGYAADQRVVATTITPGDDELIRRVTYLHPVLEDTPLGCRVVEADRFVDAFTANPEESRGSTLEKITQNRVALSQFLAFTALAEKIGVLNRYEQCPIEELKQVIEGTEFGKISLPSTLVTSLKGFINGKLTGAPSSRKLLDVSLNCLQVSEKNTAACLCNSLSSGLPNNYWYPEDHTSQFREKPASLSKDMHWLAESADRFAHIDLWLHTTFAVREVSNNGQGVPDEATATPLDFDEKQLLEMKKTIVGKHLKPYLRDYLFSPSIDDFMQPLEQFIIIQRLMRAAFNGQLGERFPLEKLIVLSRETQRFVPYQPTIRWEPYQNSHAELMGILESTDETALQHYTDYNKDRMLRYNYQRPTCGSVSL
ncbi:hypothetical protein [Alteromonas stellipolaris]|uniref:hypothetical protein n=1 Tax=Alteromonas stellipolaris TaxID=233316 RepID=UPI0027373E1F|nr:hypothetical protein [Alteromonas stellipolaris]MDP2594676.1 hypothetical protein [Alteromonas stellipolaris]